MFFLRTLEWLNLGWPNAVEEKPGQKVPGSGGVLHLLLHPAQLQLPNPEAFVPYVPQEIPLVLLGEYPCSVLPFVC